MEKFIPYEKLSKKKQRELNASRRTTWALNPVTRKPANSKAYNRKTARNWKDDSNSVLFCPVYDLVAAIVKKSVTADDTHFVCTTSRQGNTRHIKTCIAI